SYDAFQAKRAKQSAVLLHPIRGGEAGACGVLQLLPHVLGLIEIVNLEFNDRDDIAQAVKLLRIGETDEAPGAVVVVKAGTENTGDFEAFVLRPHDEGSAFALRSGFLTYR